MKLRLLSDLEAALLAGMMLLVSEVVVFGGLYYPRTIAGAVARFVFHVSWRQARGERL